MKQGHLDAVIPKVLSSSKILKTFRQLQVLSHYRKERAVRLDYEILEAVIDNWCLPNHENKALIIFHITQKDIYLSKYPPQLRSLYYFTTFS